MPGLVSIGLRGILPPGYSLFASNLTIGQVRLALVRPPSDTIARATRPLPPDSARVRFDIPLVLASQAESLLAVLEYQTAQGTTLFRGQVMVEARTGTPSPSVPTVPLTYSGPGGNIASLSIIPLDDTLNAGDSVLYQVTAIDASQQPVTSFYLSWSTNDAAVPINAVGLVRVPDISKTIDITARTPNGTSATTTLTIIGSGFGIVPDSVELLPGGRQQFTVVLGPAGPFIWSVNGVDGGNSTFGTVDATGLYNAPTAVPSPSIFPVCARLASNPLLTTCATVVISPIPSAGTDVIVINDMNLFDPNFMAQNPGNPVFAANMVNYTATGPRSNGTVVMYDRGRNSSCFNNGECGDAGNVRIDSVLAANGFTITKVDTVASWASIPANVKVIFLWNPRITYTRNDINGFKAFASQGGRIVFLGEHLGFYTQVGIDTENQFLADMGSQFTNVGAVIACTEVLTGTQIKQHQATTGLSSIVIACASEALPGPNDFPLLIESTGKAVAGVAKISTTPLPAPAGEGASAARPVARPTRTNAPVVDGANRRVIRPDF